MRSSFIKRQNNSPAGFYQFDFRRAAGRHAGRGRVE
jgi:hypothetical protein